MHGCWGMNQARLLPRYDMPGLVYECGFYREQLQNARVLRVWQQVLAKAIATHSSSNMSLSPNSINETYHTMAFLLLSGAITFPGVIPSA